MFIDWCVTTVGDRMVTVNKSKNIEVRFVHTPGQVVCTIRTGHDDGSQINNIKSVPGHSELIVSGHEDGTVHLWNIEKGSESRECINLNAGVHVRQILRLEGWVSEIVASSTRLMCLYGSKDDDDYINKVAILHFND
jgi:WD40 repeat protein